MMNTIHNNQPFGYKTTAKTMMNTINSQTDGVSTLSKNINTHTDELIKISDKVLLEKTKSLASQERELLIQILHHLQEIDRRRLYLDIGYPSLWAYCTKELSYSEGSAQRRIEAMRAIRDLPILETKLEAGDLTLSNIAKAQSVLRRVTARVNKNKQQTVTTDKNQNLTTDKKIAIFKELENKSQNEADLILATHFPESVKVHEKIRPLNAEVSEVKLTATKELLDKINKVKKLFSHKHPNPTMTEVLELMADFVIAKKDLSSPPQRRRSDVDLPPQQRQKTSETVQPQLKSDAGLPSQQRRQKTPVTSAEMESVDSVNEMEFADSASQIESVDSATHGGALHKRKLQKTTTQYIPVSDRRTVWRRADAACEYFEPKTGRRCQGQHKLEIEHIRPFAFGGSHKPENLKLYCRAHNVHAATQATLM